MNRLEERRKWIDNLRWITVITVVIFHVFYYYNNIGQDPMFKRLPANPVTEGARASLTFAGIVQYGVYQWFMLLLFVVSGMCAKFTLQKKTLGQFMKARVRKILVPSTLGILAIQWIGGWIITNRFLAGEEAQVPGLVKYFISVASGTGALWFCHVLFVACLVLSLIKLIDRKCRLEVLGEKANIIVAAALVVVMVGAAQILNIKFVPTYRFGYDITAFLLGYYVFSGEKLLAQLKKFGWVCLIVGAGFLVWHFIKFYGQFYSSAEVQDSWISIVHAWFTVLGILGVSQTLLNFENRWSNYMCKAGWGIYVNHILVMIVLNTLLEPVASGLPVAVIYLIELIVTVPVSIGLWELLKRIPVIKFVLYGL